MKTIEIGLVVIDLGTLEIVDECQRFVRPQTNPVLTDFCRQLTSMQHADVDIQEPRSDSGASVHQRKRRACSRSHQELRTRREGTTTAS
ncbi:hypothetical protein HX824_25995 [Pseudomonas sp. D4002]|nr:hypothetical protein [Pseudomonas sp. D4002]